MDNQKYPGRTRSSGIRKERTQRRKRSTKIVVGRASVEKQRL